MTGTEPPAALDRYRQAIDQELRAVLSGRDLPLYVMLRYHLGWADANGFPCAGPAGKFLRPALCLLACEAVSGDYSEALPGAAALELVHNYSLVHDDIQDGDRERHHRTAVWAVWGPAQGINAGNAFRALADLALLRLAVPADRRLLAFRLLDEACLEMIEGQSLDLAFETRATVSSRDYLRMISLKTGALIRCSLQMGAALGGAPEDTITALGQAGLDLGLAFQVRDDVLGIWGDEEKTGKPAAADLRRRKKTLPVVYALENAPRSALADFYGKPNGDVCECGGLCPCHREPCAAEADVAPLPRELESLGARRYAEDQARHYCRSALAALQPVPLDPARRRDLEEIAHFLAEREY